MEKMKKMWAIGIIAVLIIGGIGLTVAIADKEPAEVVEPVKRPVPVDVKDPSTWYEELKEVGFYPQERRLCAVIDIKRSSGYNGENEYVHFWADWNNDRDYEDWGEDLGATYVPVTDPGYGVPLPLHYSVYKDIIPRSEVKSVVTVKATLGWGYDCNPDWGNTIYSNIRIDPIR